MDNSYLNNPQFDINNGNKEVTDDDNNKNNQDNLVAIVGVGFRLPSGENERNNTPQALWNNLINGFDGVVKTSERFNDNFFKNHEIANNYSGLLPLDEVKSFDPLFFGITPNEAQTIDPHQRLLLKCTWEALEDSLIDPISIKGTDTSVFIGSSTNDYLTLNRNEVKSNVFGSMAHSIANRVSYCYDLHGNSITLDTACSSSLNAIALGYDSIKNKKSKMSIVGGVNILLDPYPYKAFSILNMLSKSNGRCKSFDASADGFVRGECIGVVILKNLKDAIKDGNRIYCTINGASANVDGIGYSDKSNFYSPSSISQSENLKNAIQSTNGTVKPSDIDYVEAHGTGTPNGDPVETEGISKVFKDTRSTDTPLLIGSFKSNIGHCEAASGIASLIKCCLMYKNKCFAPNIHFKTPNPAIKFKEWNLKVVTEPIPFNENKNTSMIINNFGVTGSNCCLVLSQFNNTNKQKQQMKTKINNYLIPFSANSVESLKKYQSLIINSKENELKYSFEEFVKNQVFIKPTSLYQRSVIVAKDWNDFNNVENQVKYQTSSSTSSNITITNKNNNPITVFVFCGQGSQYNTMALELYKNEKVFRNSMDMLDNKMKNYFGYSILEKLRAIQDSDKRSVHEQTMAQPSTVIIQVSLYELYKHWGIKASFMLGHSLGEVTTAYCSGMIDIDQLCYLIYHRSTLQIRTNGLGKMLSINISSDEYKTNYMSRYPTIEIACYNSPSSIVIAGNEQILNEISKELKEKEIFSAMLGSLSSFHTSSQNIIKDDILNLNIQSSQPVIPTFSTVTSNLFNESTIFDSEYFFDNISKPVSFTQTISNLYKHIEDNQIGSNIVFIEIAPHPTLSFYLKQMIPKQSQYFRNGESISVYSTLHKKKNDVEEFQKSISQLFCDDAYDINFKCQFNNINSNIEAISNFNLPLYQWDDQHYWLNKSIEHKNNLIGPPISILGNSMQDSNPFIKSYQTIIDTGKDAFKYLKGHNVSDKCYFPGAGYIDNLLKLYPNQDLTINSIEFKTPLILSDDNGQFLQTNVYQTGKSDYRAQFHFKDNRTNVWVQTCTANFQLYNNGKVDKLNLEEIKSTKCNLSSIPWDKFYPHIKNRTGLNYKDKFQNTIECYLGDNCSLTEISLELPENFHDQESFFNTPILDICFHGSIVLIKDNCKLVLDKIDGFKLYTSNIPKNRFDHLSIFVYTTMKSTKSNSYNSTYTVMLEDGTVILEVENLICTSLTPVKDPLLIEIPTDMYYTPYLQSKDSQIQSPLEFKSIYQNNQDNDSLLIPNVVLETIKPLINEQMEFRILEFGGNNLSNSTLLLNSINSLLEENPHYEIDIEYTWSDNNSSILKDAKLELSKVDKGYLSILYRSLGLDVDNSLLEKQKLNPSYYDLIIVSNISNLTKDIKYSLNQIYQILTPNGNLIINEQQPNNENNENNEDSLKNLLVNCNFNSDIMMKSSSVSDSDIKSIIIQAQKPSLKLQPKTINTFDQVILYCNQDEQFQQQQQLINKFESHYNNNCKIIKVSTIEEFYKLSTTITNNSIIYFIKSIEQLTLENFKSITFEYVQINQKLYEFKSKCTHVLITYDSQSSNYLSSSILGAARYFDEIPTLQLFTFDFDKDSLINLDISVIDHLIDPKQNTLIEFFIKKNGKVYFERFKKGLKKNSFKSESYHQITNEQEILISKLDENLDYQLKSKDSILKPYDIEVEIKATGLNYKDYLVYSGLIKLKGDSVDFGLDFSGRVSRVGIKSSKEFKVGDEVYGIGQSTSSSHIIIDSMHACHKPSKITHVQAASIPAVYATSIHSLYNIGNLREGESILIHSGSGGVGLSALEILKSNNHSSPIFVTVGSEEKKQYLINTYGNLITGIYSTRDTNYQKQIKNKLIELGYETHGVDLIINTLSSEFMDSNFKCLNPEGRIVDLTITHLNPNEFIDNNKFKYNFGYHNIELYYCEKPTIKKLLQSISKSIENNTLNYLIPITEFSNSNIKKAIEYINERKHVGKIVISHDTDITNKLIENQPKIDYSLLKSNYKIKNLGKNVLVTGQTGLILDIINWIMKYNSTVENIIILSKSSMKWEMEFLINNNKTKIKFYYKRCDIGGDSDSINKTFDKLFTENPTITNIDSIFHFAVVQITRKVKDIDMKSLNISHDAKTIGAINLHNQSIKRDWKLSNFILASSILSKVGSLDQCGYVSACCVLDSFSKYRLSIGLPALSINIGAMGGSGMVARSELVETVLNGQGYNLTSTNQLLGTIDLLIQNPGQESNNLMVGNFNFPVFNNFKQKIHQKFDFIFNALDSNSENGDGSNIKNSTNIKDKFLNKVSEFLSIDSSKINNDIKLMNYGADSLITVQLKNWVDKEWSPNLITIHQIQSNSIGMVCQIINDNFEKKK